MSKCESCVLVTGDASFVGSWTIKRLVEEFSCVVVLCDFYGGSPGNLRGCLGRVVFVEGDVGDGVLVLSVMGMYGVRGIVYFGCCCWY